MVKAVIMAGGLGTRLRPLTIAIPKPLVPVNGKPILEIIIDHLKEHGITDLILTTNYLADMVESYFGDGSKWGVNISYSRETEPLGTVGPLNLLKDKFDEPMIVMNGDILTKIDFRKLLTHHEESGAELTIVTKTDDITLKYGVIESEDGFVKNIKEKPKMRMEVSTGIHIVNPSVLDAVPEGRFDMPDLINNLAAAGRKVSKYDLDAYWLDIGKPEDFEKAQREIKTL